MIPIVGKSLKYFYGQYLHFYIISEEKIWRGWKDDENVPKGRGLNKCILIPCDNLQTDFTPVHAYNFLYIYI